MDPFPTIAAIMIEQEINKAIACDLIIAVKNNTPFPTPGPILALIRGSPAMI